MSIQFRKTEQQMRLFQQMDECFASVQSAIKPYATGVDGKVIADLRRNFKYKTEDFFRKDRKLNIAVIGRVKAGKSTFLNTIIFGGKNVLPQAFTPKTATLTKIEYACENALEIEYYSAEEWDKLHKLAVSNVSSDEATAAKELMDAVSKSGISVELYLQKGKETIAFPSEDMLMNTLNEYVGENGSITPLVKSVILYINKPELEGISIVDTPGLNDPIISRTDRTRAFLEICDIAFLLSPASNFLDKMDVDLLQAQLPQKGIAQLVLICSRYDDGLVDTITDGDSFAEVDKETRKSLRNQAGKIFDKYIADYRTWGNDHLANLLEPCKKPLFLSALLHTMAQKDKSEYNEQEAHIFDNLNYHDDLDRDMMSRIGDIQPVLQVLNDIIARKDERLAAKAEGFIPAAQNELSHALEKMKKTAERESNLLANNDKEQLEAQRKGMQSRIHDIKAKIEEHFGEMNIKMEEAKVGILRDLRQSSHEFSQIETRTRTETHWTSYKVSDSHWYKPWTWGTSHTEHSSYDTTYTYVEASDALENIRHYANEASSAIEEGFVDTVDVRNLKARLLKIVVDNFDASSESFDPAYFRLMTEKTLSKIELPVIRIDVESYITTISSSFSGEIRNSRERSQLTNLLAESIGKLFDTIADQFMQEIKKFQHDMDVIKEGFSERLLKDINEEFAAILQQCEEKEANIERLKAYQAVLVKLIKGI